MKKILTTDWHVSRIFRLVTGLAAIIYAIVKADSIMGIAGAMLLLMGLSNTGCGGSSGCGISLHGKSKEQQDIRYDEVK